MASRPDRGSGAVVDALRAVTSAPTKLDASALGHRHLRAIGNGEACAIVIHARWVGDIGVVNGPNGKYLRTYADGRANDNLLSLPSCA